MFKKNNRKTKLSFLGFCFYVNIEEKRIQNIKGTSFR